MDDITEEIETKYGHIEAIAIPRPKSADDQVSLHMYHASNFTFSVVLS